jgi:hypothetical protein
VSGAQPKHNSNPHALSDELNLIGLVFRSCPSGAAFNADSIAALAEAMEKMRVMALGLEHRLSQLSWNAAAQAEAKAAERVLQALHRPGSNVVLFPSWFDLGGAA